MHLCQSAIHDNCTARTFIEVHETLRNGLLVGFRMQHALTKIRQNFSSPKNPSSDALGSS